MPCTLLPILLLKSGCWPLNGFCTPLMDYDHRSEKHLSKAFWTEGEAYVKQHTKVKSWARAIELVPAKREDAEGIWKQCDVV